MIQYRRAYRFFFERPTWPTNLLIGSVCQLIPLVGSIVYLGYTFEVVEALHRRGDHRDYPDFDFNRFLTYLIRGLWPFAAQILAAVPAIFVTLFLTFGFLSLMAVVVGKEGGGPFLVLLVVVTVVVNVLVALVLSVLMLPVELRAGLGQDLNPGALVSFTRDFLKRVGKETLLGWLFLVGTGMVVGLVGTALCCVGTVPATVLIVMAQHHISFQLYELYLKRGGSPIPLQVELASDDRSGK